MVEPQVIAQAINEAPAFMRLGLSLREPRFRERASLELASWITERILEAEQRDANQLHLPL